MYHVDFPSSARKRNFHKNLLKLSVVSQDAIMEAVEGLAKNPRPYGAPKIKPPISIGKDLARYRIRIGNYRVLYDVDDKKETVWILALRQRSEKTYKNK